MRNPFVALKMAAVIGALMAQKAAVAAFNLGMQPRDGTDGNDRNHVVRHSGRTVAQDKRDARKARNRLRNKR